MPGYSHLFKDNIARTLAIILVFLLGISAFGPYQPGAYADATPDLTVTSISLSPGEPAIDDTVTITVTVKNQGSARAFGSFVVCYVDSTILDTKAIDPLEAGVSTTLAYVWKATRGSHTVKAIADSSGIVSESDENNNTKLFSLTTTAADLIIQSLTWTPANPSRGDTIVFSIIIKNLGNSASQFTSVNFYLDGVSRGSKDVAALNPGEAVTKTYNWTALPGEHALKAVIDEPDNVEESDETNNELPMTFTTLPPDLIVQSIIWTPENPSKGDNVTFTVVFHNLGSGRADASYVNFYIDEINLSGKPVPTINADATCNVTFNWTATADAHNVKAIVDFYQKVTENDETNNEFTASLTTIPPDLVVTDVSWVPLDAAVGDNVTFSVIVANQGGGRAEASRAVCYIDGKIAGYLDFPAINAGTQATRTLVWLAENGSHDVSVIADYNEKIVETRDDDNQLNITIPIIPPDLTITGITFTPENPSIGETVTFTIVIRNLGGGTAQDFKIASFLDDALLSIQHVGSIAYNASANVTATWKSQNGLHTFKAIADYNSDIQEEDETNNICEIPVAPNMPDLTIAGVSWSPAVMPVGQEITFDIIIKNRGNTTAAPSRVAYYVDDANVGYTDIGQLDADAADTEHLLWTVAEGHHTIKIVVDANNQIIEANEANNTRLVNLPPPDMIVQNITFSPPNVPVGATVTIAAIIKNQGDSSAPGSTLNCYIDGSIIATQNLSELAAGGMATKTFNWIAEAGTHTVKITADIHNTVIESDETNNDKETPFSTMTPDLTVQDISWEAANTLKADEVSFTITVKNRGTGPAPKSQLKYAIDQNTAILTNIAPIPVNDIVTFSFSTTLKGGVHTANITVDAKSEIVEIDETNNKKFISFSTIAPDLTIKTITWAPLNAVIGDTVTVTVKVENRGREKALNPRLALSVDNATIGSVNIPEIDIGEIASADFSWKALAGPHEISVFADADGQITENNETNNTRARTLTFTAPEASAGKATVLNVSSTTDEGLISDWWWLLIIVAVLLGGAAFVSAFKTLRKK